MMINPVLPEVLTLLRQHPEGISEYRLMKALEGQRLFAENNGSGLLGLYRKHFLIMNALYDLQEVLWQEEDRVLDISPLHIELHDRQKSAPDENTPDDRCEPNWYPLLSEYYLDWEYYRNTTEQDIQKMLDALGDPVLPPGDSRH